LIAIDVRSAVTSRMAELLTSASSLYSLTACMRLLHKGGPKLGG